jgi:hypothetical protein
MASDYLDVDIKVGIWAVDIVMAVGRGAAREVEMADALRAAGAVFCAMLNGMYPEFLARRCDIWLYQLAQEMAKYGLQVSGELLNVLLTKEFPEVGEAMVRHEANPAVRYWLWQQRCQPMWTAL